MIWKEIYSGQWQRGVDRVKYVQALLARTFPQLAIALTGYGAGSASYLPPTAHERGEPDISVFSRGSLLCFVEVSGSDKRMGPTDYIWLRPDKFEHARRARAETWFYFVYRRQDLLLDRLGVEPFKAEVWEEYPHEVPEKYIHIPANVAYSREALLWWLLRQVN